MSGYDVAGQRVLVTGATAGIGKATARQFAEQGASEVIVTGRREKRLTKLANVLEADTDAEVTPVSFDVRDREHIDELADERPDMFTVDVLVNNAGLARGKDAIHNADLNDVETMIDTNVKGLIYLTRKVLPHMVDRKDGHIVNLGSSSGRWVYPGGTVYCSTKFAVRAITEGTRMDVHGNNVRVTNIEPGIVDTEFSEVRFDGDTERAESVYEDTRPLTPNDVVDTILWSVSRPEHVNVQELVIYPTDQAAPGMVHRED
jgi:NADP-dependent 3-hydroxy acid dehydrogenase YdfG